MHLRQYINREELPAKRQEKVRHYIKAAVFRVFIGFSFTKKYLKTACFGNTKKDPTTSTLIVIGLRNDRLH